MSVFLGTLDQHLTVDETKMKFANIQYEAMKTSFNTMLYSCLEKCISHDEYGEDDLTKGEMCCIDRCIAKIHYANRYVGAYTQRMGFSPDSNLKHYENFKTTPKAD
ncbi:Tim12p SCDLUD_000782 [Saccharomycodes ludwigii]|uniref:Tim12p n=1 Tax=Saccharomycodes ludwigii TaxID=36035 RepID=UPI001E89E928|nr:hypothetical protein SCDLUD_000782 [Saccharomycodes ludwigii]KAH3903168.1 hypothetical protein SCDLUD_000782 [Saccharomycodes ludwigii]